MLYIERTKLQLIEKEHYLMQTNINNPMYFSLDQKCFTGKCDKLASIFSSIGSSVYHLNLQSSIKVHPIFHFSRSKYLLGSEGNLVLTKTLVTFEDLSSKPHKLERILD